MYGCMQPEVDAAPTVVDRTAQLCHRLWHGYVHGRQGCFASLCLYPVVKVFEAANGATYGNDVMRF